ncbi:MAG: hypothetical protein JOZ60_07135, partial [Verrucomicrobia bacterium]|nr:hypothetical protein [Verrucomicrobiota bacterium]
EMRQFGREGALFCAGDLVAQLYGRIVIWLVAGSFGPEVTGAYVYIRNVVIAAIQGVGFVLRVEFPAVAREVRSGTAGLRSSFSLQRWSIFCSLLAVVAIVALAVGLQALKIGQAQALPARLAAFSLLVPASVLDAVLGQVVIALGALRTYALVVCCTVLITLCLMFVFIPKFSLEAILVIEATMYATLIAQLALVCHLQWQRSAER